MNITINNKRNKDEQYYCSFAVYHEYLGIWYDIQNEKKKKSNINYM